MPDDIDRLIALLNSTEKSERRKAIKALKEAGKEACVPLLKALNSPDETVRQSASEVLGLNCAESINTFLNLLKTGSVNARDGAARTIGFISKEGVAVNEQLYAMLLDDNFKSREGAALALGYSAGPYAPGMLCSLLADSNKNVREQAANSLDRIGWKSGSQTEKAYYNLVKEDWDSLEKQGEYAIPALEFGIRISDAKARKKIANVLSKIKSQNANSLLNLLLEDSDSGVRLACVTSIAEKRDASLFSLLVECMNDTDPDVRIEASWALEKAGWKPEKYSEKTKSLMLRGYYREVERIGEGAIPSLVEFLGDDIFQNRENAYKILYTYGKPGIDAIKTASGSSNPAIQKGALEALAYVREQEIKNEEKRAEDILNNQKQNFEPNSYEYWEEILIKAGFGAEMTKVFANSFSQKDPVVRIVAVENLKKFGKCSSDILFLLTGDENENVRIASIETLGEIYEKKSIPVLLNLIEDDNEKIRQACAYSLGKLHDPATIPVLIRHFQDTDENVRRECSSAVAKTGNTAIPFIQNMIFHPNHLIRISSIRSLGEISDPAGIPLATRSLNDTDENVRREAMDALLKFSNFMFNFLMMEIHRVCIQGTKMEKLGMLSVLSKTGDLRVVSYVKEYLRDEDEEIRRNAKTILEIFTEKEIKIEREKLKEHIGKTAKLLRRKLTLDDIETLLDRLLNSDDSDTLDILKKKLNAKEIEELIKQARSDKKKDTSKLLGKKLNQEEIDELLSRSVYVENNKTTQLLGKKLTQDEIDELITNASSKEDEQVAKNIKKQLTQNEIDDIIKKELEIRKKVAMEVSRLIVGLKSEDARVREEYADKIVNIGEPAVEPLLTNLNNNTPKMQDIILNLLIRTGKPGIRGMIRVLNYGKPEIKIIVAESIAGISDNEAANALHDRIYTEKDPDVKRVFVECFGKLSDSRVFDIMNYALMDKNPGVRAEAVKILARLNDRRAIEPLILLFEDQNLQIRDMASSALVSYNKSAEKPLLEALRSDKNDSFKELAANTLESAGLAPKEKDDLVRFLIAKNRWEDISSTGQTAIRPLSEVLSDLYSAKRMNALDAIIAVGTDLSVAPLLHALFDMDEEIAEKSHKALLKLGMTALPKLKDAMDNTPDELQKESLRDLVIKIEETEKIAKLISDKKWDELERCGPKALNQISVLLTDKNSDTRISAVRIIGRINTDESHRYLTPALFDKSTTVSNLAKAYLIKAGISAITTLEAYLKSPGFFGDKAVVENLIKTIRHNEKIRSFIINDDWAGLKREGGSAFSALSALLKSKNPEKRYNAALLIAEINSPKAVLELVNALFDSDEKVSGAAESSLLKKGKKAIPILMQSEDKQTDEEKRKIIRDVVGEIEELFKSDE